MSVKISAEDLLFALEHAALDMIRQKDSLCELDARAGDGDLGVTVEIGCRSIAEGVPALRGADVGTILVQTGRNFTRSAASTFGLLVGAAFRAAGKYTEGKISIDLHDLSNMGDVAVQELQRRGGAQVGDKTLLDALAPVVEALKQMPDETALAEALERVTYAAERGMQSTLNLQPRFGRASWLAHQSIGALDAGATAVCLFLKSMAGHLTAVSPEAKDSISNV